MANEAQQLKGHSVASNELVILSQYAMHHDPALWHCPHHFDPTRFAGNERAQQARFAYFPYGGGVRTCLGIHLAQMELPLIIGRLFSQFQFRLATSEPVGVHPALTLRPAQDVSCYLSERT